MDQEGTAPLQPSLFDLELEGAISEWCAFQLTHEDDPFEVEIPVGDEARLAEAGFITPMIVEGLMAAFQRDSREEAESRPLPPRLRLRTLLKGLPVVWLDAVSDALDLPRPRKRADGEAAIAAALGDPGRLRGLVEGLGKPERELLRYLLDRGGLAKGAAITGAG